MASYNNFQVGRNKNSKGTDKLNSKKNPSKLKQKQRANKDRNDRLKLWTTFYRKNVHRFVQHYMGIDLYLFQYILIYLMNKYPFFEWVASRGIGKSFLIAIYCVARCILYPGTKVVIASGTKKQSKLIITEKIEKELMKYANVAREIKKVKTSANDAEVIFHNGSTITAVASTENSRGYRCNILIVEEFRLVDKKILDSVLIPFLNVRRQPPYLKKEKYKHLVEPNIEIYISSAWYKAHWMWESMLKTRDDMLKGKDSCFIAMDYFVSMAHGLLDEQRVKKEKEKSDAVTFYMEYENMMFGESDKAYFQFDDLRKCRTLKKVFVPPTNDEFINQREKKKKTYTIPKKDGEIRIIGMDIALMGGSKNDLTIFTCIRLIPMRKYYEKQICCIEPLEGSHTERQAIRLKQLYADFDADYVAMDTNGNGLGVYDACSKVLYDDERDVEYDSWTAFNDEKMATRALDGGEIPVIFSVKVSSAELNHKIAVNLKTNIEKKKVKLLIDELNAKDHLPNMFKNYKNANIQTQVRYENSFIQTTAMINELINLEYVVRSGFIKLEEPRSGRKDRYSSIAYAVYLAKLFEDELEKDKEDYNWNDYFITGGSWK